ncbi:MAG TPA: LptF/LptG family permease, partial [Gemmatimonadaceae bacterium]|nr:LptF/LptG family permease [Gemmatimonadaceae bacterium]
MKILTRYVLKEHVGPLFFSLAALTALLLLQQVAKRFGDLVGKGLSWGVIGEFFLLSVPFIIAMTLPMAVLVAVLYAFSRLASENEITALRASGVSILRIVRPVLWAGLLVAIVMLGFNDQVLSRSNHRLRTLQTDIARKKPTFTLREQVMNEVSPGKLFLKTGHIDPATNKLREVTIYDFTDPLRRRTVYADSGVMGITPDMKDLQMTLYNGYSTTVPRESPGQLERVFFTKDFVRVRGVGNELQRTKEDNYKGSREMSVCEMEAQYQRKLAEYADAKKELADALAQTTHLEVTGQVPAPKLEQPRTEAPAPTRTPAPRQQLTIGGAYCSLVTKVASLFTARTASAAELPQGGQGGAHTPPQGARSSTSTPAQRVRATVQHPVRSSPRLQGRAHTLQRPDSADARRLARPEGAVLR